MIKKAPVIVCDFVEFFHHQNFGQPRRRYKRGLEVSDLGGDGDDFHSVRVPEGCTVRAYEHDDFCGAELTIHGPWEIRDLDNFQYRGQNYSGWGDKISSLRVFR